MANDFWKQWNRRFNRLHFRDTEIKTKGDSIYINPTMKFIFVWAVFLIALILFLVIGKPFSKDKKDTDQPGQDVSITADNGQDEQESKDGKSSASTENTSSEADSDPDGTAADPAVSPDDDKLIKRNEYPAVNSFAESYLNATTNCDYNMLCTMVSDPTQINMDELEKRLNYATKYSNPECYTAPGLSEGSFVVYVVVNTQIPGVNVQPLSIHQFYLIPTAYGGYVHDNTITSDSEIMAYIRELDQNPEIIKVFDRVEQNNIDSAAQDETLQQFYDKINAATESDGSASEESTSE
ncbi:MAG: hypothetical protein IJ079_10540 [Lachnospiraceae bacterium]|nr:hypothetical protein [Lachnospiraceae bacterium]